jgi:hypothetical protein
MLMFSSPVEPLLLDVPELFPPQADSVATARLPASTAVIERFTRMDPHLDMAGHR